MGIGPVTIYALLQILNTLCNEDAMCCDDFFYIDIQYVCRCPCNTTHSKNVFSLLVDLVVEDGDVVNQSFGEPQGQFLLTIFHTVTAVDDVAACIVQKYRVLNNVRDV